MPRRLRDWIEDTSPSGRWVFVILLVSFLVGLFYAGVVLPYQQTLEEMKENAELLDRKIEQARLMIQHDEALKVELFKWKNQILRNHSSDGRHQHLGEVFGLISDFAAEHAVDIVLWKPLPVQQASTELVKKIPVMLTVEGPYHQIVLFFDQLRQLPKFLTVRDMTMHGMENQSGQSLVHVSCQLVGYEPKDPFVRGKSSLTEPSRLLSQSGI